MAKIWHSAGARPVTLRYFAGYNRSSKERRGGDSIRNEHYAVLSLIDDFGVNPIVGHKSLKVKAVLGENTGGGLTKWFEPTDRVFIRFYVKFDEACDYIHHMCTLRDNEGLHGKDRWSGFGGAGIEPQGDEHFSTAIEPWGNWGRWAPNPDGPVR